ncbi:MAG: MurR/RpiR family transcriptional regulator, partial [Pauljensenia sp.]
MIGDEEIPRGRRPEMTWDDIAGGDGGEDALPLTVRIRGRLPELQPAMRRVGEFIVAQPSKVAGMTISALAEAVNTSETTVIRFCREIGVKGYAQLRLALAVE